MKAEKVMGVLVWATIVHLFVAVWAVLTGLMVYWPDKEAIGQYTLLLVGISFVASLPVFYKEWSTDMSNYLPTGWITGVVLSLAVGVYYWLITTNTPPDPVSLAGWIGGISILLAIVMSIGQWREK